MAIKDLENNKAQNAFKKVFYNASDAILIISGDKFIDCNESTIKLLNAKNKEDVLITHPSYLSPKMQPDGRSSFEKANDMIAIAFKKGFHRFEWMHKKLTGEVFPVEVSLTVITYNNEMMLHTLWKDLTEQKKNELELANYQKHLEELVEKRTASLAKERYQLAKAQEIAHVGTWELNFITKKVDWTEEVYKITSTPFNKKISLNYFLKCVHPDDLKEVKKKWQKALKGAPYDIEYRIISKFNIKWVHVVAEFIFNGQKQPVKAIGSILDITEHKLAQERIKKSESQLHQAKKMETVGQLAGGFAHEFNNILTVIMGSLELNKLEMNKKEPITDLVLENINTSLNGTNRAAELINKILIFTRKNIMKLEVVNLNDVLNNLHNTLCQVTPENIQVKMFLSSDLKSIKVDKSQIEQIILNLVLNAKDALMNGGCITVSTSNTILGANKEQGTDLKPGSYILFTVLDNGKGMSSEVLKRIFDPFFTTKTVGKGTGLGLSSVYGSIKQLKGDIVVNSKPRKGTLFKIYLPAVDSENIKNCKKSTKAKVSIYGSSSILVCDDNVKVLNLICSILKSAGNKVLAAESGLKAIEIAKNNNNNIDLLITDIVMPNMNGKELSNILSSKIKNLKTLYISGYTADIIVHHGILNTKATLLNKPFSPAQLLEQVQTILL